MLSANMPFIINNAVPWVSSQDVSAGARWRDEVATVLQDTNFGIICVTRSNQQEPWLNFEAGALAKAIDTARVVPLAIDLGVNDITGPLSQFQGQPLTKDGMAKIFRAINKAQLSALGEAILEGQINMWWPKLVEEISVIRARVTDVKVTSSPKLTERNLLEEILEGTRWILRKIEPSGGSTGTILSLESRKVFRQMSRLLDYLRIEDPEDYHMDIEDAVLAIRPTVPRDVGDTAMIMARSAGIRLIVSTYRPGVDRPKPK